MDEPEQIFEKRKKKIISWIKKPYNFTLVGILVFAFIIRLYYYFLTKDQAVWWDAAEYMNMARAWAFGLEYRFLPVRPILFSLILSLFYRIGNVEFLARIFIFLLSLASIIGTYFFSREIFNKKIGLICTFLMSVFYLHIFHTYRLLVDLPSLTFFIFSGFFFYKYFKSNSKKALYIGAAIIAIGTLFRITTATFLFSIAIYVVITEKLKFIRKKEYWIAGLIFLLILCPYLIWGYFEFNGFVITLAGAHNAPKGNYIFNGLENFKSYLSLFPGMFSWPLLIFFILGLLSMYRLILCFDILLKENNPELKRDLLLILLFLIPIIITSFSLNNYFEDRYIINTVPVIFMISSVFIIKSYYFIKKKGKFLAIIFLIMFLGFIAFSQLKHADGLIKEKMTSYSEIKQAGLWLKENSNQEDIILSRSSPHIKYYSEREAINIPATKKELETLLESNEDIKFYVVSLFENHQEWMYSYPQEEGLPVIQVYFLDSNQQQPSIIIYSVN